MPQVCSACPLTMANLQIEGEVFRAQQKQTARLSALTHPWFPFLDAVNSCASFGRTQRMSTEQNIMHTGNGDQIITCTLEDGGMFRLRHSSVSSADAPGEQATSLVSN